MCGCLRHRRAACVKGDVLSGFGTCTVCFPSAFAVGCGRARSRLGKTRFQVVGNERETLALASMSACGGEECLWQGLAVAWRVAQGSRRSTKKTARHASLGVWRVVQFFLVRWLSRSGCQGEVPGITASAICLTIQRRCVATGFRFAASAPSGSRRGK